MVLPCPRYDDADDQTTPALDHHHGLSSLLGELRAPEVGVKLVGSAYNLAICHQIALEQVTSLPYPCHWHDD